MKYLIRWAPAALVIVLFFWVMSVKATQHHFWPDKFQAESATYQEEDDLSALEEYLEMEEVHYILKKDHPRSLTIYYAYEEDWRQTTEHWVCEKTNVAFPKAQLKSLSIVNVNDITRGTTDFDC